MHISWVITVKRLEIAIMMFWSLRGTIGQQCNWFGLIFDYYCMSTDNSHILSWLRILWSYWSFLSEFFWDLLAICEIVFIVVCLIIIIWNYCRFSGLTIIRTIKKQVREIIEQRMRKEALNGGALNRNEEKQVIENHQLALVSWNENNLFQLKDKAASLATTMDLHSVKLKFECLVERSGLFEAFTLPVYSTPIYNLSMLGLI